MASSAEMGHSPEKKFTEAARRPTESDFEEKIKNLLAVRESSSYGYESVKADIEGWAGGEKNRIREVYYSGWKDEDFVQLLERLKKFEEKFKEERY
ncbi:MAG: hypothetical protein WC348_02295 [Patescibacteria group bacterium]|jgi:hypothetical protein